MRFLLNRRKTISVHFNGTPLQGPNEHGFFYTAIEVFYRKLYIKLRGCNHILDLGGYLGESAVFLSLYNKKVTVVEANPSNFTYLQNNIGGHDNITAIQGAIVHEQKNPLYHAGGDFSAGGYVTTTETNTTISNVQISDIRTKDIDALKMDIEGGEYDIIGFLQSDTGLQLQKGYIEFHNIIENKEIIVNYINYLIIHGYCVEYEDIYGKPIDQDIFLGSAIAVLYFDK